MTDLRFTGWIPIGVSPPAWEGKPVLWRDNRDAPIQVREIPKGFSRSVHHCGAIEVSGIEGENPFAAIPDALETARAEIATLEACLKDAIEQCPACFWHPGHEPDEWFREEKELRSAALNAARAEIATLTEQRDIVTARLEELIAFSEQRDRAMAVVEAARPLVVDWNTGVDGIRMPAVTGTMEMCQKFIDALSALDAEAGAEKGT